MAKELRFRFQPDSTKIIRILKPGYHWFYTFSYKVYYDDRIAKGLDPIVKHGETNLDPLVRILGQCNSSTPGIPIPLDFWQIPNTKRDRTHWHPAIESLDGINFAGMGKEWFMCSKEITDKSVNTVLYGISREYAYGPRLEQHEGINAALHAYFDLNYNTFLLAGKMRFGKIFTTYMLMKRIQQHLNCPMRVLILTQVPEGKKEWIDGLNKHIAFVGCKFVSASDYKDNKIMFTFDNNNIKILFIFASLQDITANGEVDGKIKPRWKDLYKTHFDHLILDEDLALCTQNTQKLIDKLDVGRSLTLSGTPQKLLMYDKFSDENAFFYSYVDEQNAKTKEKMSGWLTYEHKDCPTMHWIIASMNDIMLEYSKNYGSDENFTLNKFFTTYKNGLFVNVAMIRRFLDFLACEDIRSYASPFYNNSAGEFLTHMLWYMYSVASVKAMARMLEKHPHFSKYKIVVAAGDNNGVGKSALKNVHTAIKTYKEEGKLGTITLSCGKLQRAVTVPEWNAVFMLSDIQSFITYWQVAFRCQSPNPKDNKQVCFLIDFDWNRTLTMLYEFAISCSRGKKNDSQSVKELLATMPFVGNLELKNDDLIVKILETGTTQHHLNKLYEDSALWSFDKLEDYNEDDMKVLDLIKSAKGSGINEKISEAKLKKGKIGKYNRIDNNVKDERSNIKNLLAKLISISSMIPQFLFLSNNKIESLSDLLMITGEDQITFKICTGIDIKIFESWVNKDRVNKKLLDNDIYRSYNKRKEILKCKSIIDKLKFLQEELESLNNPNNTEIYTPSIFVKEISDKFPKEIWNNPNLTLCDPAVKSGIYLSEIFIRLMSGLSEFQPNEQKRYIYIVENMLYGYTTSDLAFKVASKLLMLNDVKCNHNIKNKRFLEENIEMKFDVIVGNPPFQGQSEKRGIGGARSNLLWPKFVIKVLCYLKETGYLAFIHPGGWRKPESKLWSILRSKQIEYLEMHPATSNYGIAKTGSDTFGVGTSYDIYILQNVPYNKSTKVIDFNEKETMIDLREWPWLPGGEFKNIKSILSKTKNESIAADIISDLTYLTIRKNRKNIVSLKKDGKFKYPCLYRTYKGGSVKYYYSNTNKYGHFGIPKIIYTDGGHMYPINDFDGNIGLTARASGIKVTTKKQADLIYKALSSKKFKKIIWATKWSNYMTERNMFKYFRKDFWREFVDENGNEI
jgi:hypothetical protein